MEKQIEKPKTLDYILAFLPIPYLGEKSSKKLSTYAIWKQFNKSDLEEIKDRIKKEVVFTRIFAYTVIPSWIGIGIYHILK